MDRLARFLADRSRLLTVLVAASLVAPALLLPGLRIDNSVEVWLRRGHPALEQYGRFLARYGSEEYVMVALESDRPTSPESLKEQSALAAELTKVPGVDRVVDLQGTARALFGARNDWTAEARRHPLIRNLLLGPDERTVGILLWLRRLEGPGARREAVQAIRDVLTRSGLAGRAHLAGTPVMNVALDEASRRSSMIFLPLAVAVAALLLALVFRGLAGGVVPMFAAFAAVLWVLAAMVLAGRTLNMVTVTLPSLLFILSLSSTIHLASRLASHRQAGLDMQPALRRTVRELILPTFLSSITTAVGFLSLMYSDMGPVRDMGLFSAVGLMVAFAVAMLAGPGGLWLLSGRPRQASVGVQGWLARSGNLVAARPRLAAAASLGLLGACAACLPLLRVESNVLKFFPDDSPIARDYAFVSERLTGLYTIEIDASAERSDEAALRKALARLGREIEQRPEVARVDEYSRFQPLLESLALVAPVLGRPAGADMLEDLAGRFRREEGPRVHLRASILVRAMSSGEFYGLIEDIRARAGAALGPSNWELTGVVWLLNDVQQALVQTQVSSFAVASLVVLGMIGLLLRSARAMAGSVVPNLLPIFSAFAVMALAGIPLDSGTVMIASIAIGIAVDDTVHFLTRFRAERQAGLAPGEAIAATFDKVGPALVFTSVIAACGFAILALAEFRPIRYFGGLTALTMLAALAGDLYVLPAMVRLIAPWRKP